MLNKFIWIVRESKRIRLLWHFRILYYLDRFKEFFQPTFSGSILCRLTFVRNVIRHLNNLINKFFFHKKRRFHFSIAGKDLLLTFLLVFASLQWSSNGLQTIRLLRVFFLFSDLAMTGISLIYRVLSVIIPKQKIRKIYLRNNLIHKIE